MSTKTIGYEFFHGIAKKPSLDRMATLPGRTMNRLLLALGAAAVVTVSATSAVSTAQAAWPDKPIRLIVPFAPGGVTDAVARILAPRLSEGFGQQVLIENRGGAGGTVGEALLAKSAPDGYSMMLTADGVPANPHLFKNLSYDIFRDLMPVSLVARVPLAVLVHPGVPANTIAEFITHARGQGGKLNYASPGTGTSNHLYMEVLKQLGNFDMQHVPYKGGGPAMTDLMAGQVQAILISVTLAAPQVKAGKVKALAVTAEKRAPMLPQTPTFVEAGINNFAPHTWSALFLPANTPEDIVGKVFEQYAKVVRQPEVESRLRDLGAEVVMSSRASFTALLRAEYERLGKLIQERKISAE